MRADAVINQLVNRLPAFTPMFSASLDIVSVQNAGGQLLVETNGDHGLTTGKPVFIEGVDVPIQIASISRVGTVGTLVTDIDHDLTLGIAATIALSESVDAEFNGTFTTINIVNRRTITFVMPDSGPTSTTGTQIANAASALQAFDGLYAVVGTPSTNTFLVSSSSDIITTATGGTAHVAIRISGSATVERAAEAYTQQGIDDAWLFVVLGDVSASRSRRTNTDHTSIQTRSNEYRQQLIEPVSLFVIANPKDQIAARKVRDDMSDLMSFLCRSIVFKKFPTNLHSETTDPLVFVSHGLYSYDGSIYVHEFSFEANQELVFEDTVGQDLDVAFRNIEMNTWPNTGTEGNEDSLNLDDIAL